MNDAVTASLPSGAALAVAAASYAAVAIAVTPVTSSLPMRCRIVFEQIELAVPLPSHESRAIHEGTPTFTLLSTRSLPEAIALIESYAYGYTSSYGSPPSPWAMETAKKLTESVAKTSLPSRVVPLADGGIALEYSEGSAFVRIEILNEAEDDSNQALVTTHDDAGEFHDVEVTLERAEDIVREVFPEKLAA
jgi:hypothetical protein